MWFRVLYFGVEVCKNYVFGISLDDASQCNDIDVCPSGSDSDCNCNLGQSCYGVEVCKDHLCGVSLDAMIMVNAPLVLVLNLILIVV